MYARVMFLILAPLLATTVHAQGFVMFYESPDSVRTSDAYAVAEEMTEDRIKTVSSLDDSLSSGGVVILLNADPAGEVVELGGRLYAPLTADVVRMAMVMAAFSGEAYPATGLPGVKTYVSVLGSESKPLYVAKNFIVWNGSLYSDGNGTIYIAKGTSYKFVDESKFPSPSKSERQASDE